MGKDTNKVTLRTRTEELRREIEDAGLSWRRPLRSRNFGLAVCIWAGFVLVVSLMAIWTRYQPLIDEGRIARETKAVRAEFRLLDEPATDQARNAARLQAPHVYSINADVLDGLRKSLESLPEALKDVETVAAVEPSLVKAFGLSDQSLEAVRRLALDGQIPAKWSSKVQSLAESLARAPLLDSQTYQREKTGANSELELRSSDQEAVRVRKESALSVDNPALGDAMRALALNAGFQGPLLDVVAARLTFQPKATYSFDSQVSIVRQDEAAARVVPTTIVYPEKDVMFRRGEVVTAPQLHVYRESLLQEREAASVWQTWVQRGVIAGVVTAVAAALAGYTALFVPRIRRNPARMSAIAGLLAGTFVLACYASAAQPGLIAMTAVAPTVFVAVLLCVSYDQRVALAYASLHGVLVATALDQPIGVFAVMITGVGVAVWRLKEVRDRDALIKMGIWVAGAVGMGTFVATLMHLPITKGVVLQAMRDAGLAGAGGLLVSGVTLFILPTLEKVFDITTGMTLVELRDPKQPLLRQLQQRAPGTYNHSLNLASLAEAASEAIGANGLLAYVGALYHDIGKMNKPDYFVENQQPGFNRHDRLSPAMSLLVIVGHVKDGMELAREFKLPRPLHHFIESHHGTTLVEYFYHRARRQAEASGRASVAAGATIDDTDLPSEIEYRYPGPKPRSKESAIIMLCDAVESAARAMADPTPARIDATVRAIANKRLTDGQFDDCDITLRELNIVVEAVSKALASIYHGRIAYPNLTSNANAAQPGMQVLGPSRSNGSVSEAASGDRGNTLPTPMPAGIAALSTPIRVAGVASAASAAIAPPSISPQRASEQDRF